MPAPGRKQVASIESLVAINEILDDVLYGTYGVNSTSAEVHGRLCEQLDSPLATASKQAPDNDAGA